jgi:hypothetical protein
MGGRTHVGFSLSIRKKLCTAKRKDDRIFFSVTQHNDDSQVFVRIGFLKEAKQLVSVMGK